MRYVDKLEPSSCMHRMCVAGARAFAQKENIMLRSCLRTQSCKLLWPRNYLGYLKANWNWWLHACPPIFLAEEWSQVFGLLEQLAWIIRKPWLVEVMQTGHQTRTKVSLQFAMFGRKGFAGKQNTPAMNVVLMNKCWISPTLPQQLRLIQENHLYRTPPEVFPFFWFIPKFVP